jgi:hypothetical protein
MGIKEKFSKRYAESYMKKYGDRITQVQGNVISVKVEPKSILWLFHKLKVTIFVRPERSKSVVKCVFEKNKWFKKPSFITITQGNLVVVQGMKGKKGKEGREQIQIMNVRNLSTKKDLVPVEGKPQKVQRIQRTR